MNQNHVEITIPNNMENSMNVNLRIINLQGSILFEQKISQKIIDINLDETYTSGVYLVQLSTENEIAAVKLVVIK